MIIEFVPEKYIKIKTYDASIYVYDYKEVEKIIKESIPFSRSIRDRYIVFSRDNNEIETTQERESNESYNFKNVKTETIREFKIKPMYKGCYDFGYTYGVGEFSRDRISVSVSQGVQIVSQFYIGAGAGLNVFFKLKKYKYDYVYISDALKQPFVAIPLFLDLRTTFLKKKNSPFLNLKVGYTIGGIKGVYVSPIFGGRFGIGERLGVFIGLGYEYQKDCKGRIINRIEVTDDGGNIISSYYGDRGGLVVKLGVDF